MTWNEPKPTYSMIIGLFVSTSMFYSHYKHFNKAVKYPEMVEWLEERPNGPSDMDIWGKDKPYYTFVDLMKWLKEASDVGQDSSDGGKRKGKKVVDRDIRRIRGLLNHNRKMVGKVTKERLRCLEINCKLVL